MNARQVNWLASAGMGLVIAAALLGLWALVEYYLLGEAAFSGEQALLTLRVLLIVLVAALLLGVLLYRRMQATLTRLAQERAHALRDVRESERRLAGLLDRIHLVVVGLDRQGIINYVNPHFLTVSGYTSDEVLGKEWFGNFLPLRLQANLRAKFQEVVEGENVPCHENAIRAKNGEERLISWNNSLVRDADGRISGVLSIGEDITDRKKAELELRASEARLKMLLRKIPGAVWTTDRDLTMSFLHGGQAGQTSLGTVLPGQPGPTLYEYFGTRDPSFPAIAGHLKALRGEPARYEIDWSGRTFQANVEPLTVHNEIVGCIGVALDITERIEAERNLTVSEARYRLIAEISGAGIWQIEPDGKTIYANPSMCTLLQIETMDELKDHTYHRYFTPDSVDDVVNAQEMRRRGIASMYEAVLVGKRGRQQNVLVSGAPLFHTDGRLHSIIGIFTDITERKQMEQSLRESEHRYRALFDTNPYPVYVFDLETLAFVMVNEAAVHHYGYSQQEFLRMRLPDIRLPEDEKDLRADLERSKPVVLQGIHTRHRKKDGSIIEVELSTHDLVLAGRRVRLVLAVDITARKELEMQLRQAQKMEAVGRLAGGVAHDFNNSLTVIGGFCDMVLRQLGPGHPASAEVEEIRDAADRATALTRQLLAFSRKNVVAPRVLDLNQVVANLQRLLRRLIGEDIELVNVPSPEPAWVMADAGQIEQVLVNLAVNSRDAMPKGGRLTLSFATRKLGEAEARKLPGLQPGWFVVLSVADTGVGMPPEVRQHLFEPFFTTKPQGLGTGLGLFTAYGILRHHQGQIDVHSEPGKGTVVLLYLPRALPPTEPPAPAATPAEPARGSETILLVEDEPILRTLLSRVLAGQGYRVLEASHGEDALRVSGNFHEAIDLLVTDLVMPKMGGRELGERLGAARPTMKILYISGYTDGMLGNHEGNQGPVNFLQKPFLPMVLAHKVREILVH